MYEEDPIFQIGITPAGAGNRVFLQSGQMGQRDHPRGCGEQPESAEMTSQSSGSPPRVRGTALFYRNIGIRERITPAGAGNS